MKHTLFTALVLATASTQASALSCARPDVVRTFQEAAASNKTYFVIHGDFTISGDAPNPAPVAQSFEASFSGRLLTKAGFTQQVAFPLTVNATCAGDWCGKLELDAKYVAFVESPEEQKFVLELDACSSLAIRLPDQDAIKRLENCAQGGACEPAPATR